MAATIPMESVHNLPEFSMPWQAPVPSKKVAQQMPTARIQLFIHAHHSASPPGSQKPHTKPLVRFFGPA
jgi:hypothetical protein